MVRAVVWLFVLLLVGCGGGRAEPPLATRLQRTLDRERAAQQIPGAAAAVVAGGRVVWVGASGLADVRRRVPVSRDTRFAIASVTKPFVAGLVAQLAATGVLGLDDPLSRWVPRFPGARRITLRQLLDQTSGLDDYVGEGRFVAAERRRGPDFEWAPRELLRYVPSPLAAPGERWNYSNANYLLLGLVVERAFPAASLDASHARGLSNYGVVLADDSERDPAEWKVIVEGPALMVTSPSGMHVRGIRYFARRMAGPRIPPSSLRRIHADEGLRLRRPRGTRHAYLLRARRPRGGPKDQLGRSDVGAERALPRRFPAIEPAPARRSRGSARAPTRPDG